MGGTAQLCTAQFVVSSSQLAAFLNCSEFRVAAIAAGSLDLCWLLKRAVVQEKALGLGPLPKACKTVSFLCFLGGSKAMEAASSAYYNPANPHNVYMPMVSAVPVVCVCLLPLLSQAETVVCFLSKVQPVFILNTHRKYVFSWEGAVAVGPMKKLNPQSEREDGLKIHSVTAILVFLLKAKQICMGTENTQSSLLLKDEGVA